MFFFSFSSFEHGKGIVSPLSFCGWNNVIPADLQIDSSFFPHVVFHVSTAACMRVHCVRSDASSSLHWRFWQTRGEKEDGQTELGQWVAELPTQSECWMSEEGLKAPRQMLTSLGILASGKTSPCKYYILSARTHARKYACTPHCGSK